MTTKLKIDLSQGVLEVEGSETFVKAIYADFKAHFVESDGTAVEEIRLVEKPRYKTTRNRKTLTTPTPTIEETTSPPAAAVELPHEPSSIHLSSPIGYETLPPIPLPEPKEPPQTTSPYRYIEDLRLDAAEGHPSLVKFMDAKLPVTNEERNLVFLYYLQHILKVKPITLNHIYTCYRAAKIRVPLNLENSLRVTATQRHWIKIAQNGNISITSEGKHYTEKQLPKKVKT